LQNIRTPFWDAVMKYATLLGEHGIVAIALSIILIIFSKTRKTGVQVFLSIALAYIVANLILKNVVARVRPYDAYTYLIPLVNKPHDWSFPSGHTVNVFAAATAIFLCHKKTGVIALILAALVAFSRLYVGVHYPTDVLVGAVIGILFALLVHYLIFPACDRGIRRLRERKKA
jgi:undecaprenyl-diphosphatase